MSVKWDHGCGWCQDKWPHMPSCHACLGLLTCVKLRNLSMSEDVNESLCLSLFHVSASCKLKQASLKGEPCLSWKQKKSEWVCWRRIKRIKLCEMCVYVCKACFCMQGCWTWPPRTVRTVWRGCANTSLREASPWRTPSPCSPLPSAMMQRWVHTPSRSRVDWEHLNHFRTRLDLYLWKMYC